MRFRMAAVFDVATGAFARPIFVGGIGAALRSFADEVNRPSPDNVMYQHPEDFQLFDLGEWDDAGGLFHSIVPVRVVTGVDVKLPSPVDRSSVN